MSFTAVQMALLAGGLNPSDPLVIISHAYSLVNCHNHKRAPTNKRNIQFECCVGYRKYTVVGLGCCVVTHYYRWYK